MTTRITLTILLTTWVVLMVGEAAAFLTARQIILTVWDDTLTTRATRTLEEHVNAREGNALTAFVPPGDAFEIRDEKGGVVAKSGPSNVPSHRPASTRSVLVPAPSTFALDPAGHRVRIITLELRGANGQRTTIRYISSTERFERLLLHLSAMLLLITAACGLTTAWPSLK